MKKTRHETKLKQSVNPCGMVIAVAVLCLGSLLGQALAQSGGELRFCLRTEPKTFDPLKVDDDASAAIRYLTGGVLVRVNRQTQELEPGSGALVESIKGRPANLLPLAQRNFIL